MGVNKDRGTRWETRVARYLGLERRAQSGNKDKGDIRHPSAVIECKNHKSMNLAGWMDEAEVEKRNAGVELAFVVFPRRNHTTGKGYCLMSIEQLARLLNNKETP